MILSMTAFATRTLKKNWGALTWEIRSLNHRYMELTVRLPEEFRALEPAVRQRVGARLGRGKVEVSLRFRAEASSEISIDTVLAAQMAQVCMELDELLEDPAPISGMDLLRWPGVAQPVERDLTPAREAALGVLDETLDELAETRAREGARLEELVNQRLDAMEPVVTTVRERLPEVLARLRERLAARLQEIRGELDEQRLEQEMVLAAQKMDVDEEMDRLTTHVAEVRRVLAEEEPAGRRLDFLMQELNREANTLGSKSADTETTRASVELKVLIEQMREQIQNIE
ncbi:YicC/YloC family endoribonuclease [Endothiovibrio diazotrophicus]